MNRKVRVSWWFTEVCVVAWPQRTVSNLHRTCRNWAESAVAHVSDCLQWPPQPHHSVCLFFGAPRGSLEALEFLLVP